MVKIRRHLTIEPSPKVVQAGPRKEKEGSNPLAQRLLSNVMHIYNFFINLIASIFWYSGCLFLEWH